MPSFNGIPLFGFGVKIATGDLSMERQENAFPGLSGLESLTMGTRGLMTLAEGNLYGSGAAGLASAEAIFRSYRDGNAYTLVDSFGVSWYPVLLDAFEPRGKINQSPSGVYFRAYTARFRHL